MNDLMIIISLLSIFIILPFMITFVFEFLVYLFLIKEKWSKKLAYCFLINLFTWPLAQLFYGFVVGYIGLFLIIEFGVFVVEAILIKYLFEISWKKAVIVSLIANLITALLSFSFPFIV